MADQEFLASFGVDIDESGVSRLQQILTENKTLAERLGASGTGIQLLTFPDVDPVMTRGQAFFGRAAECIEEALGKIGASCCLVPSGLCVIPKDGVAVSISRGLFSLDQKYTVYGPILSSCGMQNASIL